jgi:hypothetical protein
MDETKKDTAAAAPRRPYVTPRVEESAEFEHLVLTCTRSLTTTRKCNPAYGGVTRS